MAQRFFTTKIGGGSIFTADWGDYGDMLQHGMTSHLLRHEGRLSLERTGPYIPPITLPGLGDIVLTAKARELLESSGLTGFTFLPVEKVRIVELHWEDWDLGANEPPIYPESGEPEDYILFPPHNPSVAEALGDLWEIMVPRTATIIRHKSIVNSTTQLILDLSTWNGADLFRSHSYGGTLFSEHARDWFDMCWGEYVEFEEFPST